MRARKMFIVAGTMFALALAASCGSSSKSGGGSTATTSSGGGLTVTSAASSGGTTVNVVVSDTQGLNAKMTMTTDKKVVPAGKVTFHVTNNGTIEHETVVLKLSAAEQWNALPITYTGDPPAPAPSGTVGDKVSEATNVAETGDPNLKPGESRDFTATLAAGKYALVCNIAKHYGLGMRAPLTVS